jgi:hypothetical protein
MLGHSMMILCDVCGREVPDQASKEVIYQVVKSRYRFELCSTCLDAELKARDGHRGIPGFRKRAAVTITLASAADLPRRPSNV